MPPSGLRAPRQVRERAKSAAKARPKEKRRPADRERDALRSLRDALRAAHSGDFSLRLPVLPGVDGDGDPLLAELATAYNALMERSSELVQDIEQVAQRVHAGDLEARAPEREAGGGWGRAIECLDHLVESMVLPTLEATRTLGAVATGDLSEGMPLRIDGRPLRGGYLGLGEAVNGVVTRLQAVSARVSSVVRELAAEGHLGVQASSDDLTGTWRVLVDDVNLLASGLAAQVRDIAQVSTAIADGDLSQKVTVETRGELLALKRAVNATVDQLRSFSAEVIRVAREVGTEGKLGAQADVKGVSGVWQELTDSVNRLAGNLTEQVRNIALIATAIARGDLSQKITVEAKGEISELKNTLNSMVDRLQTFAAEVTRVAKEVGTEGKLGGQADVKGVSGVWKDLTDNVNQMAYNLTEQVRGIAKVMTAVAAGDLSQKFVIAAKGEIAVLADSINDLTDTLRTFADQVTTVAREVGIDGKLGGQAKVPGVSGTWRELTENVNLLAGNLTNQVRNIALVTTAVANGDLSQKITVEAQGEILELKETVNVMVDTLRNFAAEVTRIVREVGTEGKLGAQAEIQGVAGTWRDLTDNVNLLTGNLTDQVRNIALVTTAVANGDLSQKITVEAKGEVLELKDTVNGMVEQLRIFASEVTRVAREVGTEGQLGGQAEVPGVAGTWKDLSDSVNLMAYNLTSQVRGIAKVVTAVADGDLAHKFVVEAKGEIGALADTINNMTDTLRTFAEQVTTVAREVGIEGKLGGQAIVPGVSGTWRELTGNVNLLAGNLTNQVRNIALVTTALANGDLSQKITVTAEGEILELKDTINAMVEKLRTFAREVTRVAREVGTEGILGGQAEVPGVAGTWQELTESVNVMAGNLTQQVRGIARVVTSVAGGDLSQKLVLEARGEIAALADTINGMTDTLRTFADQVTTMAREVGMEGKLGGQARVPGAAGTWKDLTDSVNMLGGNLTAQVRNIALVTTAVARGDLSRKITVAAEGEILELKDTMNDMVDQLRTFAAEVTRVAREVGTEGQLGGQAEVPGVSGTWKALTDNVNLMASNLTDQVRGIGSIVTGVARGQLNRRLQLVARGEIAVLADTINDMIETLRTFAEQVTTVAREVGIEGQLGGQAKVPGAAGTWRDLTDNVNQLAANLTTYLRAISEVASAVIQGDLSRTISVEARGEVKGLNDTINQMITNLRDTTRTNTEQDWLKTNLARFFGLMQGQRSLEALARLVMSELTPMIDAQHGAMYLMEAHATEPVLHLTSSYAYIRRKHLSDRFALGEGLVGQCALERRPILVTEAPPDYIQVSSGLGEAPPRNIVVFPVLFEEQVRGVIELASFHEFTPVQLNFIEQLMLNIGLAINLIGTSMRTEELLQQLQGSNQELERRRKELEEKAQLLETRNREIAEAGVSLESKARELAKVSQYKSQFLANMSHEIRTPLNSMMILAQMLAANDDHTMTAKQQEYAETIHSSGRDLLALINQILDLSKVEAGRIETHYEVHPLADVAAFAERTFRPVALQRGLEFTVHIGQRAPPAIVMDRHLLEQILKNLLSNAFKFTDKGGVALRIDLAPAGTTLRSDRLRQAEAAIAFAVSDSGIGISVEKQRLVFDAFQQADPTIIRRYGGTGLGLTISREYARVLGGEIQLESTGAHGSTFTLLLPILAMADAAAATAAAATPTPALEATLPAAADDGKERPLEGRTILVVDDDARNLYAVVGLLERAAARVVAASSAREAITALEQDPTVDLVLMDVMMPEKDGLETTRELRATPKFAELPIIALTAKASESDRQACFAAGCNDYVVKPVEIRQLVTVIARNLHAPVR